MTLQSFLAAQPKERRGTYRAAVGFLKKLGPLVIEPVEIGILVKRSGTFCELRPRKDSVELSFKLGRCMKHPRVRRTVRMSANRTVHFVRLERAEDFDDEIREWLAESYLDAPA